MYKALVQFTDLQDDNHKYLPGDIYPRKGLEVSEARIRELSTNANKRGRAVIEAIDEPKKTKVAKKVEKPAEKPTEKPVEESVVEEPQEEKKAPRKRTKKNAD